MDKPVAAANPKLWTAVWNSSMLAEGDHTIEVWATSRTGATSSNIITARVRQSQPTQQAHVDSLLTGKYATQKKGVTFVSTANFFQGDTVVFRAQVVTGTAPVAGAVVTLSIAGAETVTIISAASNSLGIAEAKWVTKAPSKRNTGTGTGSYTATVTAVAATGYGWDGAKTPASFNINPR